jgi:uncharacterized membrane protein
MNPPLREPDRTAEKETTRLEAFSDGVFAIAITLLVLDLKVPKPAELGDRSLWSVLRDQWPAFLAYFTSFATILVMWVNHHVLFGRIRRSDQMFLFLNGFLLLFVAFVPFPTALLAQYLRETDRRPGDAHTAAAVYAGTYVILAIAFNLLWHYAARGRRLLARDLPEARIREITRQYAPGIPVYGVAVALAFVSVPASFGLCLLLALFFAFTGAMPRFFERGPGSPGG